MADVGAAGDAEGVEDSDEVVNVGIQGGVPAVVEVIWVDAAGAHKVVEDDLVVAGEVRQHALPRRLVGAETVGQDEVLVAGTFDADIECVEDGSAHISVGFFVFGENLM